MPKPHPPCPRCYSQEEVIRPWRGFKVIRVVWVTGGVCAILLMPLVAMDFVFTLPLLMVYGLAAGPVFGLASQDPVCRSCGLGRPKPGWHETPVRPLPAEPPASWSARRHVASEPSTRSGDDEVSGLRRPPMPDSAGESDGGC